MGDKVIRATDEEKIEHNLIDEKKLEAIMKKFLGSKKADPEVTKWYRVEDGLHFMATTLGSAVYIHFENKFAGSYSKGTGKDYFIKPMTKGQFEKVDQIPEIETIKEGKKNVERHTGNYIDYPDIPGMFNKYNIDEFYKIEIDAERVNDLVSVHEAMSKVVDIGGAYSTACLTIMNNELIIRLHDSPVKFEWRYDLSERDHFYMGGYYYDFDLMTSIFQALKDIKPKAIEMYMKDIKHPILFIGKTTEYNYKFAINRKLVKE